jgi:hypothetical protein
MISKSIYIPYTYILKFKVTGQLYYGSSYANSTNKIANPSQLWNTYFTSSKEIHKLISEYGIDSFDYQIRKVFTTVEQTLAWETKILTKFDAAANDMWINKHNGGTKFKNIGRVHDDEWNENISIALSGKVKSDNHRKNISLAAQGRVPWNKGMSGFVYGKQSEEHTSLRISNGKKTIHEKYGVTNPSQIDWVIEKIKETKKNKPYLFCPICNKKYKYKYYYDLHINQCIEE